MRTPGEFAAGHIEGSYNVPLDLLQEHRNELREHLDEQVVLVCRSGERAAQAEQALADRRTAQPAAARRRHRSPGRRPARRCAGPGRAGTWNARSGWSPARSCWSRSWRASWCRPPSGWPALIGAGLTVAALTNTCMMGMLLAKLPYNRGAEHDVEDVVAALAGDRS